MADGGQIRAGAAFVELFFRANPSDAVKAIQDSLKNVGQALSNIGTPLLAAGSAITAVAGAAIAAFTAKGADLADMAARTRMSAEALSGLAYAAESVGAAAGDIETAAGGIDAFLMTLRQGAVESHMALSRMSLTLSDLDGKSKSEQFNILAAGIAKIENPLLRSEAAAKAFGGAGEKLLPMMGDLATTLERAKAVGAVFSSEDAAKAKQLSNAFADIYQSAMAVVSAVGSALAPAVTSVSKFIQPIVKLVADWTRENSALVQVIAGVGAALVVVGGGLIGLGTLFSALAVAAGGFAAAWAFIAPAIFPIAVAVASVGGAFVLFGGSVQSAMGKVLSILDTVKAAVAPWVSEITAAIADGDFAGAMQLVWSGWQLAWAEGVAAITLAWIDFKEAFLGHIPQFWQAMESAWDFIKQVWASAVQFLADGWTGFLGMFGSGFKAESVTIADLAYETAKVVVGYWADLQGAWTNLTTNMLNAWTTMANTFQTVWADAQQSIANGIVHLWGMVDETLDKAGALNELNAQYAREQAARDGAATKAIKDRNEARDKSLADIEKSRKAQTDAIDAMKLNAAADGKKLFAEQRADAGKALADARAAAAAAIDAAKKAREGTLGQLAKKLGIVAGAGPNGEQRNSMPALASLSAGTFSASAAGQMFGGRSPIDRVAVAAEKQVEQNKEIIKLLGEDGTLGGMMFT